MERTRQTSEQVQELDKEQIRSRAHDTEAIAGVYSREQPAEGRDSPTVRCSPCQSDTILPASATLPGCSLHPTLTKKDWGTGRMGSELWQVALHYRSRKYLPLRAQDPTSCWKTIMGIPSLSPFPSWFGFLSFAYAVVNRWVFSATTSSFAGKIFYSTGTTYIAEIEGLK